MKKNYLISLLAIILAISLLPICGFAEELTNEEAYRENVEMLSIYMRADPEASVDIAALRLNFDNLHHYQYSTEFSLYAKVLEYLEHDDYNNAASWLSVLCLYPEFDEYIASDDFREKYPEIRGLSEMETYISGRREEAALNYSAASTYYKSCLKFFDAMDRYQSLYVDLDVVVAETLEQIKEGDYAKALKNAEHLIENNHEQGQALYDVAKAKMDALIATPVPTKVPTPTPTAKIVTATATPAPEKTWGAWSDWSTTKATSNSTTQVEQKTQYRSRNVTKSQEYTSWGSWSDWSTTAVSESSTKDVETRKQYRYRDTTYTTEYSWSSWSGWSTNAVSASDTRQVETKKEQQTSTTKVYKYSRWKYYNTSYNTYYYSYSEYKGSSYKSGSGKWEYKTTTTPLSKIGSADGRAKYEGYWYNQSEGTKETTQEVTMYRYRTRTEKQVPVTGSWSGWSTNAVSSTSTREVQTRTQYRSRTRSLKTVTNKGGWSAWSDTKISESSTREVETRVVYRYRKLK